jgi:hypothetical protein
MKWKKSFTNILQVTNINLKGIDNNTIVYGDCLAF